MQNGATDGIDTLYPVATPEGIDLLLRPAGPVPRAAAWLVDSLIRAGIVLGLVFVFSLLGALGMALFFISWFLINWWYPVLFEVLWQGATPGKRALGLRVLSSDGTPVAWGPSIVRNLLRQVDFLPLFYATGLVSMHCNARFQRLGDLAAGTLVVYQPKDQQSATTLPPGPAEPPPVPLRLAEQQAIVSFAERSPRLNPQRAAELAGLLAPLTGLPPGDAATARLMAWARWIHGQGSA